MSRMTRAERLVSASLILGILGGSLASLLLHRELWPFSQFPMYSVTMNTREPALDYAVYAVVRTSSGATEEIRLDDSPLLRPYNHVSLMNLLGFSKLTYRGLLHGAYKEVDPELYDRALRGLAEVYRRNLPRSPGTPAAGKLIGMRFYALEFIDPRKETRFSLPARRILKHEVALDG